MPDFERQLIRERAQARLKPVRTRVPRDAGRTTLPEQTARRATGARPSGRARRARHRGRRDPCDGPKQRLGTRNGSPGAFVLPLLQRLVAAECVILR